MKFKKLLLASSTSLALPVVILSGMTSCSKEDKDLVKVDKITSYMYVQLLYSDPITLVENGKIKLQWNHSKFDPWPVSEQPTEKLFVGLFTPSEKTTEESITTFDYSSCTLSVDNQPKPLSYKNPEDFETEIENNTFTVTDAEKLLPSIEQELKCLFYRCDDITQSSNVTFEINITTPPNVKLVFTTFPASSIYSKNKEVK